MGWSGIKSLTPYVAERFRWAHYVRLGPMDSGRHLCPGSVWNGTGASCVAASHWGGRKAIAVLQTTLTVWFQIKHTRHAPPQKFGHANIWQRGWIGRKIQQNGNGLEKISGKNSRWIIFDQWIISGWLIFFPGMAVLTGLNLHPKKRQKHVTHKQSCKWGA